MTDFPVGQRVRVLREPDAGGEGVVVESNYAQYVAVKLDGWHWASYWKAHHLELIEDPAAPAKPDAKPECYVTAWILDEGFSHTDCHEFRTKEEADNRAKDLVRGAVTCEVAVFKLVSKHASAVTVTSEDV